MSKKNWGKSYKFKTAWVREFWNHKGERWVQFSWEDGLTLTWNVDTGEGRIN